MAFTDAATLAQDTTFVGRVRVALVKSAHAVLGEAWGKSDKREPIKRADFARRVLSDEQGILAERCAWSVVTNAAVKADSDDGDIEFTVNSMWSDWAGVLTPETG